jgi:hypothetical protein
MRLLNWNHKKVQNLTPLEIWFFIAGRMFLSFGFGALVVKYYPQCWRLGYPTMIIGIILLGVALKGVLRKSSNSN